MAAAMAAAMEPSPAAAARAAWEARVARLAAPAHAELCGEMLAGAARLLWLVLPLLEGAAPPPEQVQEALLAARDLLALAPLHAAEAVAAARLAPLDARDGGRARAAAEAAHAARGAEVAALRGRLAPLLPPPAAPRALGELRAARRGWTVTFKIKGYRLVAQVDGDNGKLKKYIFVFLLAYWLNGE
jgi:hypothetical protein